MVGKRLREPTTIMAKYSASAVDCTCSRVVGLPTPPVLIPDRECSKPWIP